MHTTIAIDAELKEDLKRFGRKGESYAKILRRLLSEVKEHQIESLLMDETDTVPIEDAIEEARRWRA
jgi:predicted CopG family antitoxin